MSGTIDNHNTPLKQNDKIERPDSIMSSFTRFLPSIIAFGTGAATHLTLVRWSIKYPAQVEVRGLGWGLAAAVIMTPDFF